MQRFLQVGTLFVLVVLFVSSAETRQPPQGYTYPNQKLDFPADLKYSTARQSCQNWAFAAGLEMLLKRHNVPLDQTYWVQRLNGGDSCLDRLPSIERLKEVMNKEFALDDGRHVRLEAQFVTGAPINIDVVIAGMQQQELSLFLWRGHPYYLTGVTYDMFVRTDGVRQFTVREMRLADTFDKQPATTFQRGRDNVNDIAGILSIQVTEQ